MEKGKSVKRCPRCQIFTEKNSGCNHMTCPRCKYQWCWLCEGKFNYGHYNSGRCEGQQFTKADNLDEIQEMIKAKEPFGLFKIFTCFCEPINEQFDFYDSLILKYLAMIGFLLFGFIVIFVFTLYNFYRYKLLYNDSCFILTMYKILVFGMGLFLWVPFQKYLTCILAPFILISLFYHKFFDKILMFFGIGQ